MRILRRSVHLFWVSSQRRVIALIWSKTRLKRWSDDGLRLSRDSWLCKNKIRSYIDSSDDIRFFMLTFSIEPRRDEEFLERLSSGTLQSQVRCHRTPRVRFPQWQRKFESAILDNDSIVDGRKRRDALDLRSRTTVLRRTPETKRNSGK